MKKIPTWISYAFLIVSFLGFVDATYLTVKYFQHEAPTCTILEGCEQVTTSQYSEIFGIPVALLGALYYLTIFLLAVAYLDRKDERILRLVGYATVAGLLASAWFVYAQLVLLDAICLYCMGSAATSTLLFMLGMWTLARLPKKKNQ